MKKSVLALLLSLCVTSSAFAGVLTIRCQDAEGSYMSFSESSFAGGAFFVFSSPSMKMNLKDDSIVIQYQKHLYGDMIVSATQEAEDSKAFLSFSVPYRVHSSLSGRVKHFSTRLMVSLQDKREATEQFFNMQCQTEDVVYFKIHE